MPTFGSLIHSNWIRSALAASQLISSLLIRLYRATVSLMVAVLVLTATLSIYGIGPAHNGSPADGAIPDPIKTESSQIIIWSVSWGNNSPHFFVAVQTMGVSACPQVKGMWYDGGVTNLYKTQTRSYAPDLGRFTQVDPARAGTNWHAYCGGDPVNRSDPSGLDWEWTQDNSVELNKGHWEYIPGTDLTVPQPLPTFTPQNNGGSSQFTWGDAGNLMGFYAERGMKTTNPEVKTRYANALLEVDELASLSARIGQVDADNLAALITARERFDAHLASGQATEDYYVGKINAFNPRKVPLMAVTLAALHVAGTITAPLEVPLTALSAPGVMNAPLPGAKQVGAAALVLSKAPRALIGLGRAGSIAVQAERMVVPLVSVSERAMVVNSGVSPFEGVRQASRYLREAGVPRDRRVEILQSFENGTINLRSAGSSEYGLRYFDGVNAFAKGRYLFETFPASRESLALLSKWNQMTGIAQWQIRPGATIIEGRAAAQGPGLPGGQIQKFIPNINDLLSP